MLLGVSREKPTGLEVKGKAKEKAKPNNQREDCTWCTQSPLGLCAASTGCSQRRELPFATFNNAKLVSVYQPRLALNYVDHPHPVSLSLPLSHSVSLFTPWLVIVAMYFTPSLSLLRFLYNFPWGYKVSVNFFSPLIVFSSTLEGKVVGSYCFFKVTPKLFEWRLLTFVNEKANHFFSWIVHLTWIAFKALFYFRIFNESSCK